MTQRKTVEPSTETTRTYSLTREELCELLNIDDGNEAVALAIASMLANNTSSWMLTEEAGLQWGTGCVNSPTQIPCGMGIEIYPYEGTISIDLLDIVEKVMETVRLMAYRNIEWLLDDDNEDEDEEEAEV